MHDPSTWHRLTTLSSARSAGIAKIMIVDDDPSIRTLLRVLLEAEGHETLEAEDGLAACELFEADPSVDGVILDVMMPRLDGFATLKRMRENADNPNVAIIMLTARSGKADEAAAMVAGSDAYVTKPFEPDVLMGLIDVTLMFSPEDRAIARRDAEHQWLPELTEQ